MNWEVAVVNNPKTTEQTIVIRIEIGGVGVTVNLLPRDAAQLAKSITEAARVATTGVILPTESERKVILN